MDCEEIMTHEEIQVQAEPNPSDTYPPTLTLGYSPHQNYYTTHHAINSIDRHRNCFLAVNGYCFLVFFSYELVICLAKNRWTIQLWTDKPVDRRPMVGKLQFDAVTTMILDRPSLRRRVIFLVVSKQMVLHTKPASPDPMLVDCRL